ncbi:MAG: S-methyl-5-thioribose kinase [Actinomycetota bacterium]|nr:S-methyl-5-thioribose kinase [Actinomycetota bacterium]
MMGYDYELLTPDNIPAYIARRPRLAELVDPDTLSVREVGDGNLNLIFICQDAQGRGICLKQSLPYVRLVGESWPLTPHRATAEARAYDAATALAARFVPGYHGFDPERFVLAMEDLSSWSVWRTALNQGEIHRGAEEDMGRYVARLAFGTSLFGLEAKELKVRRAAATNPELCEITEDLVFTEPYLEHEHNSVVDELWPLVGELRREEDLVAEVGSLKYGFMAKAEALIHGDLHTGSVMVTTADGRARAKAIDAEFCYYGPVGFDLGALFGNYLIARARAGVLGRPEEFQAWLRELVPRTWGAFQEELRALWPQRVDGFFSDRFLEAWLARTLADAVGYGGCKAIRRIIGLAKVSDIQTLEGDQHVAAATAVLRAARRWILERASLGEPEHLSQVTDQVLAEEVGR